jgi:hypothetical protein
VKFLPIALALALLFTAIPVEGQGMFDIRDRDTLQTLLGPFAHFFMPLLGFYPLRSFFLAPIHIIKDWFETSWPLGAAVMIILGSDMSTISSAVEDIRNSRPYAILMSLYHLLPQRLEAPLVTILTGLFSLLSGITGAVMLILGILPERAIRVAGLLPVIPCLGWPLCAFFSWMARPFYLRAADGITSFACNRIPGLRVLYKDFISRETGIPVISVMY